MLLRRAFLRMFRLRLAALGGTALSAHRLAFFTAGVTAQLARCRTPRLALARPLAFLARARLRIKVFLVALPRLLPRVAALLPPLLLRTPRCRLVSRLLSAVSAGSF